MIKKNLEAFVFLIGSITIIFLSIILTYQDGAVYTSIFNIRVSSLYSCPIYTVFKMPCPTCGLTRAFILFTHFKFIEAFRYNAGVFLIFPYLVAQIPFQIIEIHRTNNNIDNTKLRRINLYLLILVGVLLLTVWILKLLHVLPII